MAYKQLVNFAAGELTPQLWKRTTLDKFNTGLRTARNVNITKTGGIVSRAGTLLQFETQISEKKSRLFCPPYSGLAIEWGHEYARVYFDYNFVTNAFDDFFDIVHDYTEAELDTIHFVNSTDFLYIYCDGRATKRMRLAETIGAFNRFDLMEMLIEPPLPYVEPSSSISYTYDNSGGSVPTGYNVDYCVTIVIDGVETFIQSTNQTRKLPVISGEWNRVFVSIPFSLIPSPPPAGKDVADEIRVYRRPRNGGGWGLVGSADKVLAGSSLAYEYTFIDAGVQADYSDQPPDYVTGFIADISGTSTPGSYVTTMTSRTGLIYQDRVMFTGSTRLEANFGTRTGSPAMTRDFPLQADSAIAFKTGSDGVAKTLRYFDARGLMAFTSLGIWETPEGALTPETAVMSRRGNWVIDPIVPPLGLPGSIVFVDRKTNSVMGLEYSDSYAGYKGTELSIFSSHLLRGKRVISWSIQDGDISTLWCVLDDGTSISFCYQQEQEMRSWTRHDTQGLFENVATFSDSDGNSFPLFVVNRDGIRTVERLMPRDNVEFRSGIFTDSTVFYRVNMAEKHATTFTLTPVTPGDWEGLLTLSSNAVASFTNTADLGAAGSVFRVFTDEGVAVDLQVTTYTNNTTVTVQPSIIYPLAEATNFSEMYETRNEYTGLNHLEGLDVSVRLDGFTEGSPLERLQNYVTYTVTGGKITLDDSKRGAIVSIGLPFVSDIQTLNIDTVEQKPTSYESVLTSKMNAYFYNSRGAAFGPEFPADGTNEGMLDPEYQIEDNESGIFANKAQYPYTREVEFIMNGDWKTKGSFCVRNVNPQPMEFLSFTPDIEVLWVK